MTLRAIDVDWWLTYEGNFRAHLRWPGRIEHSGPTLVILNEAEARTLVADLQAALSELAPGARRVAELEAEVARLREERHTWASRCEDERAAHEATKAEAEANRKHWEQQHCAMLDIADQNGAAAAAAEARVAELSAALRVAAEAERPAPACSYHERRENGGAPYDRCTSCQGASRQADAVLKARLADLESAAQTGIMSAGAALARLALDFRTGRVR